MQAADVLGRQLDSQERAAKQVQSDRELALHLSAGPEPLQPPAPQQQWQQPQARKRGREGAAPQRAPSVLSSRQASSGSGSGTSLRAVVSGHSGRSACAGVHTSPLAPTAMDSTALEAHCAATAAQLSAQLAKLAAADERAAADAAEAAAAAARRQLRQERKCERTHMKQIARAEAKRQREAMRPTAERLAAHEAGTSSSSSSPLSAHSSSSGLPSLRSAAASVDPLPNTITPVATAIPFAQATSCSSLAGPSTSTLPTATALPMAAAAAPPPFPSPPAFSFVSHSPPAFSFVSQRPPCNDSACSDPACGGSGACCDADADDESEPPDGKSEGKTKSSLDIPAALQPAIAMALEQTLMEGMNMGAELAGVRAAELQRELAATRRDLDEAIYQWLLAEVANEAVLETVYSALMESAADSAESALLHRIKTLEQQLGGRCWLTARGNFDAAKAQVKTLVKQSEADQAKLRELNDLLKVSRSHSRTFYCHHFLLTLLPRHCPSTGWRKAACQRRRAS